ncbi:MAG TPA: gluconate:H+ symporter [Sediminibacterium sp.]|uniref:GntP family permease n=1 Tax=Sediminibacterium sp. TaxID=1917865 RepID=UPI0008BDC6A2|nr:gluconate:H+ symporter [Sediminibacterium sp.]OHC85706.1 MAG: gluconate transporter [Sphingobacteriia bacterium RIFOXYC2_FULL_35_18]OHC87242.1 MAG: gluconate transporter [Sphingobacteriia bacterium RIFOXYD2_FULL_35_12]HLD52651.1 gluconate:H+ symporter [Sediminibacterium sp.]
MNYLLMLSVIAGIASLLILVLYFKFPAFIALLMASIVTALIAGLPAQKMIVTIQEGMGSTLGFVATIVGLGAMFGAILEKSGGADAIARYLIKKAGLKKSPLALGFTGLIISIPVFFDVAFILLIPIIYSIQKNTRKSLLLYAMPLLAGLAFGHAFIPPTPGPIAVAEIIGAEIGWVILTSILIGIPTVILCGVLFGKFIAKQIYIYSPEQTLLTSSEDSYSNKQLPSFGLTIGIVFLPIFLILLNTTFNAGLFKVDNAFLIQVVAFIGHPFSALVIANIVAWILLGIKKGYSANELSKISIQSMAPAGAIILVTGAGGVFKQVLVDTGAGKLLAELLLHAGVSVIFFAYLSAAIIRLLQGSATVAMITAASLLAPLLIAGMYSPLQMAALVAAIAAGATIFSHVNDSGFWLVKQYLGLTENQTFKSWSLMTLLISVVAGLLASLIFYIGS